VTERGAERAGGTRERIVEATLETLAEEGFAATTARSIAARGGFNQALIFYHFGTVANLLLEAFSRTTNEQVEHYREAAETVSSLSDLVAIARRLHAEDIESGSVAAVTQLMAAAASEPELGGAILDRFEGWIGIVEDALDRAMAAQGAVGVVSTREAAYAICAMFLGIEVMSRLDADRSEAEAVFDMMGSAAQLIEAVAPMVLPMLGTLPPAAG
jgi:AcrR family transcriptional regulator